MSIRDNGKLIPGHGLENHLAEEKIDLGYTFLRGQFCLSADWSLFFGRDWLSELRGCLRWDINEYLIHRSNPEGHMIYKVVKDSNNRRSYMIIL